MVTAGCLAGAGAAGVAETFAFDDLRGAGTDVVAFAVAAFEALADAALAGAGAGAGGGGAFDFTTLAGSTAFDFDAAAGAAFPFGAVLTFAARAIRSFPLDPAAEKSRCRRENKINHAQ